MKTGDKAAATQMEGRPAIKLSQENGGWSRLTCPVDVLTVKPFPHLLVVATIHASRVSSSTVFSIRKFQDRDQQKEKDDTFIHIGHKL
ncbi:hypothetical protein EXN66_Car002894 [Channa argus]|uniref:Uncharacterized protein n=1 Tax=Channa argus TaxID=215402 RepID=A0A6G1PAF7_CHAAH|nr:hypothetical protein EXN66_Car002894 [Channa argus]